MRALADIIDKLDGNGADAQQSVDPSKPLENPVFVSPLQQELELLKQQGGKESPVINQLINQDPENPDDFANHENDEIDEESRDEDQSSSVLDLLRKRRARLDQR